MAGGLSSNKRLDPLTTSVTIKTEKSRSLLSRKFESARLIGSRYSFNSYKSVTSTWEIEKSISPTEYNLISPETISCGGRVLKPVPADSTFSAKDSISSSFQGEFGENAQRDSRLRASWSLFVVVGEIRFNVSEIIPAINNPAICAGGARPASTVRSVTSVEVLPTGSTVKRMGLLVGRFPRR